MNTVIVLSLVAGFGILLAASLYIMHWLYLVSKAITQLNKNIEYVNEKHAATQPKSWLVTYAAFIDHDMRNQGVPVQERVLFGKQFTVGSQTVTVEENKSHVFVPSLARDLIYRSLNNEDIAAIEFISVVPLNSMAIEAEQRYVENRAKFTFTSTDADTVN